LGTTTGGKERGGGRPGLGYFVIKNKNLGGGRRKRKKVDVPREPNRKSSLQTSFLGRRYVLGKVADKPERCVALRVECRGRAVSRNQTSATRTKPPSGNFTYTQGSVLRQETYPFRSGQKGGCEQYLCALSPLRLNQLNWVGQGQNVGPHPRGIGVGGSISPGWKNERKTPLPIHRISTEVKVLGRGRGPESRANWSKGRGGPTDTSAGEITLEGWRTAQNRAGQGPSVTNLTASQQNSISAT